MRVTQLHVPGLIKEAAKRQLVYIVSVPTNGKDPQVFPMPGQNLGDGKSPDSLCTQLAERIVPRNFFVVDTWKDKDPIPVDEDVDEEAQSLGFRAS